MIRRSFFLVGCLVMISAPVFAQGLFLPWGKDREPAQEAAPAQLERPAEKQSFISRFFLGKKEDAADSVRPSATKSKNGISETIKVRLDSGIVEIESQLLGTRGAGPQTAEELMAVAAVLRSGASAAAKQSGIEGAAIANKINAQYAAYAKRQASLNEEQRRQYESQLRAAAYEPQSPQSSPNQASVPSNAAQSQSPERPSLFLGRDKAGAGAQDTKPGGVFKDY